MKLNVGTRHVWLGGAVVALAWTLVGVDMAGQTRAAPGPLIRSLSEPSQSLEVKDVSARTGLVTFAATRDAGLLLERTQLAPADARALDFVDVYGQAFGLNGRGDVAVVRTTRVDALGFEHVRLQQMHRGIPVTGSQLVVHLKGARVHGANGEMLTDLPADVTPAITADAAVAQARTLVATVYPARTGVTFTAPRLEVFNRGLLEHRPTPSRLAWFVEARAHGVREFIWVDALSNVVLLNFNQTPHARNRQVFNAGGGSALPGVLVRAENDPPSGNADVDAVFNALGGTYDYFLGTHGRDSYDGFGSPIVSSTNFNDGSCPNAAWSAFDQQLIFCAGIVADDVVAHEFSHAVTEYSAGLFYFVQSGALNESFSDIFGESIDLLNGLGDDSPAHRWILGEELSASFRRHMMTPPTFGQPGKMSDPQLHCDSSTDSGGVHGNSGIPNHAYALMVDGGTFNGFSITGIGLTKAARIQYQALTGYLTPTASFKDAFNALNQSCSDLLGTGGITISDCVQVANALQAVELNASFSCQNSQPQPAVCPTGGVPNFLLQEGFEGVSPP
jgi:Zn-dependent metalloprotease